MQGVVVFPAAGYVEAALVADAEIHGRGEVPPYSSTMPRVLRWS